MGRVPIGEAVHAEIINYGRITAQEWPGSVSADALVKTGETTEQIIDEAVARLEEFYVPASSDAKTRCIDGRHDPKMDERIWGHRSPAVLRVLRLPTGWALIKVTSAEVLSWKTLNR